MVNAHIVILKTYIRDDSMSSFNTNFSMERSRTDVKYFYKWLGYTWGHHIGEWIEMYGDNHDNSSVHRVCVIAPRDHSKSTTLRVKLLHMALFEQWRNKPFTCWLFSASKDLAVRRLEEIREDMKRHPQLSRYLDPKRGNKLEIRFTNGAWIRATSVGAAIRGEHPAAIAFDDVLDDMGDMIGDVNISDVSGGGFSFDNMTSFRSPMDFTGIEVLQVANYALQGVGSLKAAAQNKALEGLAEKSQIWSDEYTRKQEELEQLTKKSIKNRVNSIDLSRVLYSGWEVGGQELNVLPANIWLAGLIERRITQNFDIYEIDFSPKLDVGASLNI